MNHRFDAFLSHDFSRKVLLKRRVVFFTSRFVTGEGSQDFDSTFLRGVNHCFDAFLSHDFSRRVLLKRRVVFLAPRFIMGEGS